MSFEVDVTRRLGERTIRLAFAASEGITAIFGPSGAGKTSILNMVAGLLRPDAGRIMIGGDVLFDSESGRDLPPERRHAGYVFQEGRLFPHMRVATNLLYGAKLAASPWMDIDEATAFLGIGHLMRRWPHTLSGGEAQRVAIGRALLSGPRFLLLDEPLASLDAPRREEIITVIRRIRADLDLPILYVSHDAGEVDRLADTIVHMGF